MGLDIALGVLIFVSALRGWFKGFFLQALGLGGLVACVYLADPLRDFARPHAAQYLPGVRVELLDKLLWWAMAAAGYVFLTGTGRWVLKAYRRRPYGEVEPNRGDQGAGFVLGAAKGALAMAFLASGLNKHADSYLKQGGTVEEQVRTSQALALALIVTEALAVARVEEQVRTSQALALETKYTPAAKIWGSAPVQTFVGRVRSRGLWEQEVDAPKGDEPTPVRTASRPRSLDIPAPLDPRSPRFAEALDAAMKVEGIGK